MKTLICQEPGSLALIDRAEPVRQPGEVLLRVRRVGICGTDYHILRGNQPYLSYPRVMGHELGTEIVEAPSESGLAVGETAVVIPYLSCGECRACQRGLTNCCRRISVLGVHQDGGMAEYLAVPAGNVIAAPGLTLDQAAMVEFLAIGAHGIRRGAVTLKDRVLVVGAGPIGIAATLFAQARGAEVTVMDLRPDRLDFATGVLGAAHGVPAGRDAKDQLAALTDGEFFDVVVDATGHAPSMNAGLGFVGQGGRYVLLSIVAADISFPDPEFHRRETTLLASRNATRDDFTTVMQAMAQGLVPSAALASHRAPFVEGAEAIPVWAKPETGVIKALLEV
jgi:2-desacetyl-2-hydroxyethyl bacteriochlorophyllide A dehydrogenase